jgi:hypothetical protein
LVELINQASINLPPNFYDRILNINTLGLNSTWVEYDFNCSKSENEYDYFVSLVIQLITVSPDDYSTKEYLRRKTIPDGFQYKLDRNGNVMKDSLGNDIKVPKYRDFTCKVIEIRQMKSASIQGEVEFVVASPEQLINKEPITADSHFEHFSGKAVGDIRALEPEDMHLIEMHDVPYPDDLSMIYDCTEILSRALSDILYNNRELIR